MWYICTYICFPQCRRSVTNPDYEPQNWYCVTLSYKNRRGLDETRYVWLNPHYFGWDNGAGIMKESCSSFPFEIDPGSLGNSENYLLRGQWLPHLPVHNQLCLPHLH